MGFRWKNSTKKTSAQTREHLAASGSSGATSASAQAGVRPGPSGSIGSTSVPASSQAGVGPTPGGSSGAAAVSACAQTGVFPGPSGSSGTSLPPVSVFPGHRIPEDPCWAYLASVVRSNGPRAIMSFIEQNVPGDPLKSFDDRIISLLVAEKQAILNDRSIMVWIRDRIYPSGCLVGNHKTFDVKTWSHLLKHESLRKKIQFNDLFVQALCLFRNRIAHAGPEPLTDAECHDLWIDLLQIFKSLGCDLKEQLPSTSGGGQSKVVTNTLWMRLASVVHEHFPRAARKVCESKMFVDQPYVADAEFREEFVKILLKDQESLRGQLSRWEIDLVYPWSGTANIGSFGIVLWRKLMRHFFPEETWQEFDALPTLEDLQAYLSGSPRPCSLVDGLFQFRNCIFRSACKEFDENEFGLFWKCLEGLLTGLEYDVTLISAYKTEDFDCSCYQNLIAQLSQDVEPFQCASSLIWLDSRRVSWDDLSLRSHWYRPRESGRQRFKICLAGQAGVGKTSILWRLRNEDPDMMLEYDFFSYFAEIPNANPGLQNDIFEFMVYDTSLMEKHGSLSLGAYYRNADCVLLVYDVSDKSSMLYLHREFDDIMKNGFCPKAEFVVVRNKVDLPKTMHEVTKSEELRFFSDPSFRGRIAAIVETSAKSNYQIEELFKKLVTGILADRHFTELIHKGFCPPERKEEKEEKENTCGIV